MDEAGLVLTILGLALASFPSGRKSLRVAMMQPCVTFLLFSITSTPNWRMSPEQTSRAGDSSEPLLSRWLLTKVPLLDFVSWR